jgi:AbrB family looped-hinge helix DNA binding protein
MAKTITMSREGRLTIPAEARRALGLHDETEFEFEVDAEGDVLRLRPVVRVSRRDTWANAPEHQERLRHALASSDANRLADVSKDDFRKLAAD